MIKTDDLMLTEPAFRLKWKDGAYYVSKPSIGDTDVFTADQMRAYAALVRADEREACAAQLDFNAQAASNGGDEYLAALLWQEAEEIRARGNT